jgi:hypothetical protein
VSFPAPLEMFASAAGAVVSPSWSWRMYVLHARRSAALGCSRKQLDCDVDRVQRGEQRFKCAMHRSLVGRRNGLRDSPIFLPIYHLAYGVYQAQHASLFMDRRAPPAIRLGMPQDRAVELSPVGAFTAGMESASDTSCLGTPNGKVDFLYK